MPSESKPYLVDSTLREGEQFARAHFTSPQRLEIARALDAFGVDYIEMTSPAASPDSARDLEQVAGLGLSAKVVAHVRCHPDDVDLALAHGADGVQLLFGTSKYLREHGHGRSVAALVREAETVIGRALEAGVEVRFSCEDAFRTPLEDLLRVYRAVDAIGVHRVGIADTVGMATPNQVAETVSAVRHAIGCDIEFHGHNDTGCAVANAWAAYGAGATHLDTTVLGIGERNGIAPLSSIVARLAVSEPAAVERFDLSRLAELDRRVAEIVGLEIPFNACITSPTAFTHKAGMHTKAVLAEPRTYEVLEPASFGCEREVLVGHRLTGRHALAARARDLGLELDESSVRRATLRVKALADVGPLASESVDAVLAESILTPIEPIGETPLSGGAL